ncbi:hypothetical protein GGR01_002756 [Acetobacter oeni]|nr:hypothetical protein [Acetobacter oeni]
MTMPQKRSSHDIFKKPSIPYSIFILFFYTQNTEI